MVKKKSMTNRNIKWIFGLIASTSLSFCVGFIVCYFAFYSHTSMDEHKNVQENSLIQEEESIENEPEYSEEESELLLNEESKLLSEEEQLFLEEHIYGQWRFANRVVEIDDNNHNRQGVTANISDVGVEELKQTVVILYEKNTIEFPVKIGQDSFSNAQDMYLFAANAGVALTRKPIYKMNRLDTDTIILRDVYNWWDGYEVQIPGWEDYIHVNYYVPDDQESVQYGNIYSSFGSDIYVNPNDTDTIYIDFCGLWEMTRDDTNYSTNGKYFGPG